VFRRFAQVFYATRICDDHPPTKWGWYFEKTSRPLDSRQYGKHGMTAKRMVRKLALRSPAFKISRPFARNLILSMKERMSKLDPTVGKFASWKISWS